MTYVVRKLTSEAQIDFAGCSIGRLYRLLDKLSGPGLKVSQLAPSFGHNRAQTKKYLEVSLGLGLIIGDVHERELVNRPRKRLGAWDRYYSTTRRGDRVLGWLKGKPKRRYPDPPELRGSTRRNPRFPDRR